MSRRFLLLPFVGLIPLLAALVVLYILNRVPTKAVTVHVDRGVWREIESMQGFERRFECRTSNHMLCVYVIGAGDWDAERAARESLAAYESKAGFKVIQPVAQLADRRDSVWQFAFFNEETAPGFPDSVPSLSIVRNYVVDGVIVRLHLITESDLDDATEDCRKMTVLLDGMEVVR